MKHVPVGSTYKLAVNQQCSHNMYPPPPQAHWLFFIYAIHPFPLKVDTHICFFVIVLQKKKISLVIFVGKIGF